MTSILRRVVLAALLAAWSVPALAATENNARGSETPAATLAQSAGGAARSGTSGAEAEGYAAREKQSQGLQDFQGGDGYIYIGGGALTVVVIVLLLLIIF